MLKIHSIINLKKCQNRIPRKFFLGLFLFIILGVDLTFSNGINYYNSIDFNDTSKLKIATFDVDVTPPIGYPLAYSIEKNKWDLGLRAKGVVILGSERPIVLVAIDAIGIANEGIIDFKEALAVAANTIPDRVTVHVLHIHDAPEYDPTTEKILVRRGLSTEGLGEWGRETILSVSSAIKESLKTPESVNTIGFGESFVHEVASNRNIYRNENGKVIRTRFSSTGEDTLLRKLPIGKVDSTVSLVSFWNDEKPVAILSFFATHPMAYYPTGVANPQFVGVARFLRQLAVPEALLVHFNGAGGDVAAGKYNDGSHINRLILAKRLEKGLEEAWKNTKKEPITENDVDWSLEKIRLKPNEKVYQLRERLKMDNSLIKNRGGAGQLAYLKGYESGHQLDCSLLKLKGGRILFMPGELFVEYQLAAKALLPDNFVAMAAYGDYGPSYIGTAEAYEYGGYETERASRVTAESEGIIMKVIDKLLME